MSGAISVVSFDMNTMVQLQLRNVRVMRLSAAAIRAHAEWFVHNHSVYSQQLIAQFSIM